MTISNDLIHPNSNKLRFRLIRVVADCSAREDEFIAVRTAIAGVTVTLPANANAGAAIAVGDDDNNAQSNPISVASAATIDGAASLLLSQAGQTAIFVMSPSGVWKQVAVRRIVPALSRSIEVYLVADLKNSTTAPDLTWNVGLDLDFAAQPSQVFAADGNYTIAGKTWRKMNSVNDRVSMAIVNGQGLIIQPGATSDYNGGTRNFPGIQFLLSQISDDLGLGARVRAQFFVSAHNMAANYDAAIMSIDTIDAAQYGYAFKYGYGVSGVGTSVFVNANANNLGFLDTAAAPLNNQNNVGQLDVARLGHPSIAGHYAPQLASAPFIPRANAFRWAQSIVYKGTYPTESMSGLTPANMSLVLGAQRAGSPTNLSVTISRVRFLWGC